MTDNLLQCPSCNRYDETVFQHFDHIWVCDTCLIRIEKLLSPPFEESETN